MATLTALADQVSVAGNARLFDEVKRLNEELEGRGGEDPELAEALERLRLQRIALRCSITLPPSWWRVSILTAFSTRRCCCCSEQFARRAAP